jgi:hypothetical protein
MPQLPNSRPYSQYGIDKLEALYAKGGDDEEVGAAIWTELQHRSTDRAKRLQHRITAEVADRLLSSQLAPANASEPTTASPPTAPPWRFPTAATELSISDAETRARLRALETSPSSSTSDQKQHANAVLSSWISLEVLSPQGYDKPAKLVGDDPRCIAQIGPGPLPWERGEGSRKNYRLYYLVVFGEVNLDATAADLLSAFGSDEEAPARREGQRAPIAAVIVDQEGMLQGAESVAISSFAWGTPVVLRGNPGALGRWPEAESLLQAQLHHRLQRVDKDGNTVALDLETILSTHDWLVKLLGLNPQNVHAPSFVARLYQYYRNPGAPNMPLLNSFYVNDLIKARGLVNESLAPVALERYLSIVEPVPSTDLLQDKPRIAELVAPARFPLAC